MIKVSEKIMEIDIELNSASVARCQKCRTANVMKHLGNRGGAEPNKGNNGNNSNEDKAPTQAPTPAPTLAPTPACVDDYDLGTVAPPWSDFVSCAEEQDYCQDHQDTLMKHCKKTCGVCNNQDQAPTQAPTPAPTLAPTPAPTQAPTPAPTLAPPPACVDDYDLGTVAPPWSDFVSCAEE